MNQPVSAKLTRMLKLLEVAYWEWNVSTQSFSCNCNLSLSDELYFLLKCKSLTDFLCHLSPIEAEKIATSIETMQTGAMTHVDVAFKLKKMDEEAQAYKLTLLFDIAEATVCGAIVKILSPPFTETPGSQREEIFNAILENTSAVIFAKDLHGRYLLMNARFRNLFNVQEESIGKTDHEIFPSEDADKFREADQMVLAK
ncbi:MAG: PAS domain-containing protein, partial [Bdellovibrionales bacterium]|nr:PAS domain-containing protein [Bdellovibrionales bacterium]